MEEIDPEADQENNDEKPDLVDDYQKFMERRQEMEKS